MTQDNAVRVIVAAALITLLCLLQKLINTRKIHRGRQALLPCIAAVFGIAASVFLSTQYDWAQEMCSTRELEQHGEILLLNLLLMALFLLVKCIACPIVSSLWKDNKLMELTSVRFYEYDEVYHEWFLQKRWADFRRIVRVFALCGGVLSAVLLAATWIGGPGSWLWMTAFPCAALIVLNESWHFINGQTREEFVHSVLGDEADARREGNYVRIRDIYEKIFAPQVLSAHTGCEFSARQGCTDLLKQMEQSTDAAARNTAKFFLTYDSKDAFDPDCIQATATMMHGNSVLFFQPFYRDLGVYLTLPMVSGLMKGRKCLVVSGRRSTCEDAVRWLTDLLKDYSHLRSMWRVQELGREKPDCEVGVLSFQQLYDVDVLAANRDFFSEADFVLLLEPSIMVDTGQVGLSIVAEETCRYGEAPVYCICDRYADGLVDTMSHLLRTEITNVVAMPVPRCVYTGMAWNGDGDFIRQELFDKQTRFLGNGLELAAVAVKNQVPQVTWCGETKAPLRDLKWIAGQHYATICRYMNLPTQQKSLYEKIRFVPSLWSGTSQKEQFIVVEDEFCNMFSMMRTFLSRGQNQTFVNVLSENYLLRDYMRCNQQMFLSDPNAIPSLIPDYAKTERNTLMKLVILMAVRPVSEKEIRDELCLAGCQVDDPFDCLSRLLKKYTFADGSVVDIRSETSDTDGLSARSMNYYSITGESFSAYFADSLKNAYYIVEEEKRDTEYIDAKMFGHVTQTILPGQFVTYDGKYYEVKMISSASGIILRRASDLYAGRRYYRQIRTYTFEPCKNDSMTFARTVMDIGITVVKRDFSVTTTGYLDMDDNHDLRKAKTVSFENDPNVHNYDRHYRNKDVLEVHLPDTDDKIRFTLCLLLSEIFRSVFPNAWQYLAVLSKRPDDIEGMLNHTVYTLEGDVVDDVLYFIEDSDIDLGLLDGIQRNLPQLLELVADFLDWHFEKMREPESKDPVPGKVTLPQDEKRRSRFLQMADRIRKLFMGGREKEEERVRIPSPQEMPEEAKSPQSRPMEPVPAAEPQEKPDYALDDDEASTAETPAAILPQEGESTGNDFTLEREELSDTTAQPELPQEAEQDERKTPPAVHPEDELDNTEEADADLVHIDGTDIFENEGMPDDNIWLEDAFAAAGITPIKKSRYQRECYLKFGFEEIDGRLRIEDVRRYLRVRGCCGSALTKARKRTVADKQLLDVEAANHCDFCGVPLSGVSYDKLNDGRIRCNDCSSSSITTLEDFRDLFYRVLDMMNGFYNVQYHVPIQVKMADARTVARGAGRVFRPSTGVAPRVLGYAQRKGGKYSLLIENGSPRLAAVDTMVHEMTHIWQYLNWNDREIQRIYGNGRNRELVYEGMATWAAIQFLYQMGETFYAEQQEVLLALRDDVYGDGFRLYREKYPFVKNLALLKYSPFSQFPPL